MFFQVAGETGGVRAVAAHEGLFEPVIGIVPLASVGSGLVEFPAVIAESSGGSKHGLALVAGMTLARPMDARYVSVEKTATRKLLAAF